MVGFENSAAGVSRGKGIVMDETYRAVNGFMIGAE